jgi:hypothetical protein
MSERQQARTAGQASGGTGTVEPKPYPSCGDGVCNQTDYGISGQRDVRPNTAECNAEALKIMWNGCCETECVVKPPEPIMVCPFPEWQLPFNQGFVNPWHPGTHSWWPGDKVKVPNGANCYECIELDGGCPTASPGSFPDTWKPVSGSR